MCDPRREEEDDDEEEEEEESLLSGPAMIVETRWRNTVSSDSAGRGAL